MFIHTVFFYLKPDLSPADRAAFADGAAQLPKIKPHVIQGYAGTPAPTNRAVIVRDYSYGLTLAFADQAAHDAYQVSPEHLHFVKTCERYWTHVVIYDYQGA